MTSSSSFNVLQLGRYLATRGRGRVGRDRLDDLLADREGVDLTIDFAGVEAMTISFADEFLGKLLTSHDFSITGTTVAVTGLNAENRFTVLVCVERRETRVVVLEEDGRRELVGDKVLSETFDKAVELGVFKANDLADAMSLSPQNANNRLKRLAESGALRKVQVTGSARGGKEFMYHVLPAEVPSATRLTSA